MRFSVMRSIVRSLLVLALVSAAPNVYAQASLEGHITSGGAPVPGVNVRVGGTEHGTATDANGFYQLSDLPAGSHVLVASAVGFETVRRRVELTAGTTTVDIALTQEVITGDEVVVTATMREQYVKDSPVKVRVVNNERLQRGKASSNLMDLVGSVNGLTTQLNCAVCGTNAIRINGVEGPNTAVLIDGMPIMGALASVYGLNGISPSIIDQVEVITGPQSTLYGTQALGGVVNIITKDPENTPTFSGEVYGRSTQEFSADLAVSPTVGRFKGFVSASGLRIDHYFDDNGDGFADQVMRDRIALFGKGTLENSDGAPVLNVAAKGYYEDRTGGTPEFTDALRGSDEIYGESVYTRRGEVLANYTPDAAEGLKVEGAFTYHDQNSYYGTEHYDAQQRIAFGQATYAAPVTETLQLLAGGTLRYETYNDNTPATVGGADKRLIPGVFGQGEWALGDVTLLGGLRIDHHEEHGFITAPRLSAKVQPSYRTTVRASGGTGFRVVNVFTEDHAALTGSREVVFTEDLDPERSRSVTASVEHILPLGANPLTVSVDGFYTRFSNKIIPDYDQNPNLIVYENLDGFSVTRGFAVNLDQSFTSLPLSYDLGFTLTDVFTEEGGAREAVTYAPDYTGTLGATYQVRPLGLEVDYSANLVGPKRMPDYYVEFGRDAESPVFMTHDVKLVKEFGDVNASDVGVDVFLSAENLFDHTQGSPLVDAADPFGPNFDTIYTWGPIVGRTFSLGVRMNLR